MDASVRVTHPSRETATKTFRVGVSMNWAPKCQVAFTRSGGDGADAEAEGGRAVRLPLAVNAAAGSAIVAWEGSWGGSHAARAADKWSTK